MATLIKVNKNTIMTKDAKLSLEQIDKLDKIMQLLYRRVLLAKLDINYYRDNPDKIKRLYGNYRHDYINLQKKGNSIECAIFFLASWSYVEVMEKVFDLKKKNPKHSTVIALENMSNGELTELKKALFNDITSIKDGYIYYA